MGIANRLSHAPRDYEQGYEPSKLGFQIRDKIITREYRGEISGTVNLGSCIYGPMAKISGFQPEDAGSIPARCFMLVPFVVG